MIRICYILTILAGIGTLVVGQLRVGTKIKDLTAERDTLTTQLSASRTSENKAKIEAREAKEENEQLKEEFVILTEQFDAAKNRALEQEKRAVEAEQSLARAIEERNVSQRELNRYVATGVPPEKIISNFAELKEAQQERDVFIAENEILVRQVNQLKAELDAIIGPGSGKIPLPAGLKGRVLAVDPKWDFVVLDIGSDDGVLPKGEMMVSRDGQLVAKVQITNVMPNRSVANVMPEWKQTDVVEGDQVLY